MKLISLFTQTNYSFEGKKEHEVVHLFLYRHWFVIAVRIVVVLIAILIPVAVYPFIFGLLSRYDVHAIYLFFSSIYYLFLWYLLFYDLTMYVLDTWIVTSERIIDSRQQGFFHRTVSELELSRVQDISVKMVGFIPTLLDFGNLEIQTAGTEQKFLFEQIAHPQKIKDDIMHKVREYQNSHPHKI